MPDSTELTRIRTDMQARLMPDTCNILEVTQTADGQGGFTDSWGTATGGTAVACRLDGVRGNEQYEGAAIRPYHTYVLTLPHDTTISGTNRVEVGSNTFNVTSIDTDKSWSACVRVYLERL